MKKVILFVFVLGYFFGTTEVKAADKRIEIDLTTQKIYGIEDDQRKFEYQVSSGKRGYETPNGEYSIWTKIPRQKMSGGSKEKGTYYYLPNVPNIMFFYNEKTPKIRGFAIHGAYWHNKFGGPVSHGCINMNPAESKVLYDWAEVGTKVIIYGKYVYKK